MPGPWYILTYDKCWKVFKEPPTPENPWAYVSPAGTGTVWYTLPDDLYFALHADTMRDDGTPPSPICGEAPVEAAPIPQISKPSWLRDALEWLDRQPIIGGWEIGAKIESAADWVIDGINKVISFVVTVWRKANAAWDKAIEVGKSIANAINQALAPILKQLRSIPDLIEKGIDALKPWVQSVIESAITTISNIINWLTNAISRLDAWWDNLWTNVLPNIFTKKETSDYVTGEVGPVKEDVEKQKGFLEELRTFWNDPEKWLLDKIINMLVRFI